MRCHWVIFSVAILHGVGALAQQPHVSLSPAPSSASQTVPVTETQASQDQVQAATVNATASLREQILRLHLTHQISVNDFLDQTDSQAELSRVLKNAQIVGGPRWVDARTCQIQLQLPAAQLSAMLMGVAHQPGKNAPVQPETLKLKFSQWNRLTFSVIGSSATADAIEMAKPVETAGLWSEVSDSARRSAITQARQDAARHVVQAVSPILLNDTSHVSDALVHKSISDSFDRWLERRPISRIDFLDDLSVSVTISVPPKTIATAIHAAVQTDAGFAHDSAIDWDQFNRRLENLPGSVAGTAPVEMPHPATSLPSIVLPIQPPDWVDQQLQAEATASGTGSRLKIGRAAESDAIDKIREQFLQLHIDSTTTLGDAAHSDPQLNEAIHRALLHAHTYRVDYHANGAVEVKVDLDLRDAWDALRTNP